MYRGKCGMYSMWVVVRGEMLFGHWGEGGEAR